MATRKTLKLRTPRTLVTKKELQKAHRALMKRYEKLETEALHLKGELERLKFVKPRDLVVEALPGKKLQEYIGKHHVRFATSLQLPTGGTLLVATVGKIGVFEPSPEELQTVTDSLVYALEQTLPKEEPFAVVTFCDGLKVTAFKVLSGAEPEIQ